MNLQVNGKERTFEEVRTVSDLLEELDLDPEQVAVEVDRRVVSGDAYETRSLSDGSEVEIVTFVGGG